MKICCTCKQEKSLGEFHKDSTSKDRHAYRCKICACMWGAFHHARRMKEDSEYRGAMRQRHIKNAHGLTLQQYEEKLIAQGNKCAICELVLLPKGYGTHLDHDHKTGKHRDFLCTNCNRGIGHFHDSVKHLNSAIQYLKSHTNSDTVKKEGTHQ